uniref:Uncharacterized protein n=1 Tax=Knipowitschia caucasica TaxID=637954 RepID=A0AAV2L8H3_KNICA
MKSGLVLGSRLIAEEIEGPVVGFRDGRAPPPRERTSEAPWISAYLKPASVWRNALRAPLRNERLSQQLRRCPLRPNDALSVAAKEPPWQPVIPLAVHASCPALNARSEGRALAPGLGRVSQTLEVNKGFVDTSLTSAERLSLHRLIVGGVQ